MENLTGTNLHDNDLVQGGATLAEEFLTAIGVSLHVLLLMTIGIIVWYLATGLTVWLGMLVVAAMDLTSMSTITGTRASTPEQNHAQV